MENLQVCFIVSAFVLQLINRNNAKNPEARLFHASLAFFYFSLISREVDLDEWSPQVFWEDAEKGIRLLTALVGIYLVSKLWNFRRQLLKQRGAILTHPASLCCLLGGLFYLSSWPFDKRFVPIDTSLNLLAEEILESSACFLFLLSGLFTPITLQRIIKSSLIAQQNSTLLDRIPAWKENQN